MSYSSFDFPNTHFYDSDLREVLAKLKFLLDEYDKLVSNIADLNEWREQHKSEYEELLRRVGIIENEINTFEQSVNESFAELDRAIHEDFEQLSQELKSEFAGELEQFKIEFAQLKAKLEQDIVNMKMEINALTYELRQAISNFREEMVDYIDERFAIFIENLPDYEHLMVHNPIRGYQTTIQEAINDLYSATNFWGLTAREFDSLELTAEEFDNKGLTCHEFDTLGYKMLDYPDPDTHMLDPFTGQLNLIKNVVMELYGLHAGGDTAEEFDSRDLTAEEFDALQITAFQFDFFGIDAA